MMFYYGYRMLYTQYIGDSLKCFKGTFKSEGRKYLGSDEFLITLQGGVLYIYIYMH